MSGEELKGYRDKLMRKEEQLRDEKKQLREEKKQLMDRQTMLPPAPGELVIEAFFFAAKPWAIGVRAAVILSAWMRTAIPNAWVLPTASVRNCWWLGCAQLLQRLHVG
jgi:hypothetical protein